MRNLALKRFGLLALLSGFFTVCGCLYIPTPQHDLQSGRGMIEPEAVQNCPTGTTTREDILLRFGEPDATFENQRVFLYTWTRTQGYLLIGGYGRAEIIPVGKTSLLLIRFDGANRLEKVDQISPGLFSTAMDEVVKWSRDDMEQEKSSSK